MINNIIVNEILANKKWHYIVNTHDDQCGST